MNFLFLDKVVDKLVGETLYFEERDHMFIQYPFSHYRGLSPNLPIPEISFREHCRGIYGLNERETTYVFDEYRRNYKQ